MFNYARMRELIDSRGIKQKYLAEQLGISPTNFTNWSKGKQPSKQSVIKLSELLNVPVGYLMDEEDEHGLDTDGWKMLGALYKHIRETRKYTIESVSQNSGVSQEAIEGFESAGGILTVTELACMCGAIQSSLEGVFGGFAEMLYSDVRKDSRESTLVGMADDPDVMIGAQLLKNMAPEKRKEALSYLEYLSGK